MNSKILKNSEKPAHVNVQKALTVSIQLTSFYKGVLAGESVYFRGTSSNEDHY